MTTSHQERPAENNTISPRRIAISGSSGLVGTAFMHYCHYHQIEVIRLVRKTPSDTDIEIWDERADLSRLEGLDAVIHLAGSPIAERRWTPSVKSEIYDSRVLRTAQLVEKLKRLSQPPRCLVAASAVGFYGDRGDQLLTETAAPGNDFLSRVVQDWEQACQPAAEVGTRVVSLRLGMVLSPQGGALAKMLPAFRWGLGGRIGSGRQWWSWVSLTDVVRSIVFGCEHDSVVGAVNVTSPQPLRNADFTRFLAAAAGRPAWIAVPRWALRLGLGEMSQMLLASTRVIPQRLTEAGFEFADLDLADTLK